VNERDGRAEWEKRSECPGRGMMSVTHTHPCLGVRAEMMLQQQQKDEMSKSDKVMDSFSADDVIRVRKKD
jgi:hypothetical protein